MIAIVISAALVVAQALPYSPPKSDARPASERANSEPVVAVRPASETHLSLWARASDAVSGAVHRLWEKDEPHAAAGNAATLNGDVDGALKHYDEAEPNLPAGGDAAATLAYNRSAAMLKGSPEQAPKALEQAQAAREAQSSELRAKAAYNAGVALEAQGKPDEAIKAYANALSLDSGDVDSKVNLELLLQEHEKQKQQQGQNDKDKKKDPKDDKDQQKQQSKGEQQEKKDQQQQDQKDGDQQKKDQQQQAKADEKKEQKPEEKKEQQAQAGEEKKDEKKEQKPEEKQQQASMGRSEAQRLLDAARAGEKNLQMWRFGKKAEQHPRRGTAEKDW